MAKRIYSDRQRAEALAALDANAGDLTRTAKQLAIPRKTLESWSKGAVNGDVANICEKKKAELADLFEGFARRVLDLTTDDDVKAASLKDRFVAAAVATDKMLILRGKDPSNTPTVPFEFVIVNNVTAPLARPPDVIDGPSTD